jgi:hypothetical protein
MALRHSTQASYIELATYDDWSILRLCDHSVVSIPIVLQLHRPQAVSRIIPFRVCSISYKQRVWLPAPIHVSSYNTHSPKERMAIALPQYMLLLLLRNLQSARRISNAITDVTLDPTHALTHSHVLTPPRCCRHSRLPPTKGVSSGSRAMHNTGNRLQCTLGTGTASTNTQSRIQMWPSNSPMRSYISSVYARY